jgi:hypothetical protein
MIRFRIGIDLRKRSINYAEAFKQRRPIRYNIWNLQVSAANEETGMILHKH